MIVNESIQRRALDSCTDVCLAEMYSKFLVDREFTEGKPCGKNFSILRGKSANSQVNAWMNEKFAPEFFAGTVARACRYCVIPEM
eukprot:3139004-Amphidinium_carterae.1